MRHWVWARCTTLSGAGVEGRGNAREGETAAPGRRRLLFGVVGGAGGGGGAESSIAKDTDACPRFDGHNYVHRNADGQVVATPKPAKKTVQAKASTQDPRKVAAAAAAARRSAQARLMASVLRNVRHAEQAARQKDGSAWGGDLLAEQRQQAQKAPQSSRQRSDGCILGPWSRCAPFGLDGLPQLQEGHGCGGGMGKQTRRKGCAGQGVSRLLTRRCQLRKCPT